jgi:hypothetical protein
MSERLVEFQGKVYLLVGGALTTEELYRNFRPSLAHVYTYGPDAGCVMQHGVKIGDASEVLDLDEPVDVTIVSFAGVCDPGWFA